MVAAVGSIVRASLPQNSKIRRRGVIATIQENNACILWEDDAPRSLATHDNRSIPCKRGSLLQRTFMIAPIFNDQCEETDDTIEMEHIQELLSFEKESAEISTDFEPSVWKDRGDQLLRLGDPSAAISHYDLALKLSSIMQIGSSIVLRQDGFTKIAEVDCIDDDDEDGIDVSMTETGTEATIQESSILLCIQEPSQDRLQERILLNIARCLLQLSESTFVKARSATYLKKAVLSCTIAITLVDFFAENDELSDGKRNALLLRSHAQMSLSKFQHAERDLKQILKVEPENRQVHKQLRELEKRKKADKRLVKEMCRWVQNVADETVSHDDSLRSDGSNSNNKNNASSGSPTKTTAQGESSISGTSFSWNYIILILLFAFLVQKAFN